MGIEFGVGTEMTNVSGGMSKKLAFYFYFDHYHYQNYRLQGQSSYYAIAKTRLNRNHNKKQNYSSLI